MKRWSRRTSADIDQAIENVTWNKPPAQARPPAPGPTRPPRHQTGPLVAVTREWFCGCEITDDGTGRIIWAKPCTSPDLADQWLKDITDGQH